VSRKLFFALVTPVGAWR